ncbi:MAG: hypothetical protein CMI12_04125 [Oceanospirillum sp.]|nr:hypothetical protein [Oceanospirillum sp.]
MCAWMRSGKLYLLFSLLFACSTVFLPAFANQKLITLVDKASIDLASIDPASTDSISSGSTSPNPSTILKAENGLQTLLINDQPQAVYIQGDDFSKPILLVLHGGPGFAMMPLLHQTNAELEKHFIVVNWDQRGAGLSFDISISEESLSLAQLVDDAHVLTSALKQTFQRDKIYLLAHSFGTVIAMYLLEQQPSDYYAYAGVGQIVSVVENEQLSYDFALEQAQSNAHVQAINELVAVGRSNEDGEYLDDAGYEVTAKWMAFFGGELVGKTDTGTIEETILSHHLYLNQQDKWLQGWQLSQALFYDDQVWEFDFRTDIPSVEVPIYFLMGRYDQAAPVTLVTDYYRLLHAPDKRLTWFEHSAHFPFYEQSDLFNRTLIQLFRQHVSY